MGTNVSYSAGGGTPDEMVVAITSVDLTAQRCTGYSVVGNDIEIQFTLMVSGMIAIPQIGEQWVCKRTGRTWFLYALVPHQDPRQEQEFAEGMTLIGRGGPTEIHGSKVSVPSEFYVGGNKFVPGGSGGGTTIPAAALAWDQEMVLNAGALASGYNDMIGGIIVSAVNGVLIDSIVFRLGDPTAAIGGSGGISIYFWRGTTVAAEVTQIGAMVNTSAHESQLTLTTPFEAVQNSVLRAKVVMGSATVGVSCHVQFRGRRI